MRKSEAEIEIMAEGGRRLAEILETLASEVLPGIPTNYFDSRSRELIKQANAKPAFLGYVPPGSKDPFPAAICVSLNDVIVHGLPSGKKLQEGDLLKLDLGLVYKDFYLDAALTVPVGSIHESGKKLIAVTKKALDRGIAEAVSGNTLGDIGWAIQKTVTSEGFSVANSLSGHEIGKELHEGLSVYNFGKPGKGEELREGMVFAIEPMVAVGTNKIKSLPDGSFGTADGSLSAHFEHTVAITKNGPRILTRV